MLIMYVITMLMLRCSCKSSINSKNSIVETSGVRGDQYLVLDTSLLTSLSSTYPELRLGSRNSKSLLRTSLLRTSLTLLLLLTLRLLALGSS